MAKNLYGSSDHAKLYARTRPSYPEIVFETIYEYFEKGYEKSDLKCDYGLALDVGCGNGQSTYPLCKKFRRVIGTDISAAQIASAKTGEHENVEFNVTPGEDLSCLGDGTVDLVTTATTLQWLDRDVFYREVNRVLKPGGVLAAYAYMWPTLDDKYANEIFLQFYHMCLKYWDKAHLLCKNHYRDIEIPFDDPKRLDKDEMTMSHDYSVRDFVGLLESWTSWREHLRQHPGSRELEHVTQQLDAIYGDRMIHTVWPLYMLLSRKPVP